MTIPLAVAVDVAAARVLTRWMDFDDRVPERPGPRGKTFVGPWLEQQVVLSFVIGLLAVVDGARGESGQAGVGADHGVVSFG